jgi:hypothetical protein
VPAGQPLVTSTGRPLSERVAASVGPDWATRTGLLEPMDSLTFKQGRNEQQKKALYAALAEQLKARCGLAPTYLVIYVVENKPADWSFGLGRAQFLEGDL